MVIGLENLGAYRSKYERTGSSSSRYQGGGRFYVPLPFVRRAAGRRTKGSTSFREVHAPIRSRQLHPIEADVFELMVGEAREHPEGSPMLEFSPDPGEDP
jgi:hypothetical protein